MKLVKIIFINLIIFLVLLAMINYGAGVYLRNESEQRGREELPNYDNDREHARQVFTDYHRVQHRYEAFVGWKCLPYKGSTTTISDEGLRTHQKSEPRQNQRVLRFFGGSTMWGEGSDDANTIPALVNQKLPDYAVFNHGQLAYNTRQELDALISTYAKNKKADVVVFYDGVNDAAFLCPRDIKELPAHRLVPMFHEKIYSSKAGVVRNLLADIFYTNTLRAIGQMSRGDSPAASPYDCLSSPGKAEEIASMMMKNWELAHEIVSNRGGKFIAVLQPAAFVGKPRTDHLKLDQDLKDNFALVYSHLKRRIAEKNYPWIYDLSDRFDGDEYIFIDFCHVSPNGNAIIAKEIADIINKEANGI